MLSITHFYYSEMSTTIDAAIIKTLSNHIDTGLELVKVDGSRIEIEYHMTEGIEVRQLHLVASDLQFGDILRIRRIDYGSSEEKYVNYIYIQNRTVGDDKKLLRIFAELTGDLVSFYFTKDLWTEFTDETGTERFPDVNTTDETIGIYRFKSPELQGFLGLIASIYTWVHKDVEL